MTVQMFFLVVALVAASNAAPFIGLRSAPVVIRPAPAVPATSPIIPSGPSHAPIAITSLDALLQTKINFLLGLGAHRPAVVPVTAKPASPVVVPLASTKPFKAPTAADEPEQANLSTSDSNASVAVFAVPRTNPYETASASASLQHNQYGVPAVEPSQVTWSVIGAHHGHPQPIAAHPAAPGPAVEQVYLTDDQQQYISSYRLEDGTRVQEQGRFVPTGNGAQVVFVKEGRYEYTSPEGQLVKVKWVADQNGYRVLED